MTLRLCAAALLVFFLSACGGDSKSPLSAEPTAPLASSPRPAGTAGAGTTPAAADAAGPLPQVKLQRLGNITFANMTGFYEMPDKAGRFLVLEKGGRVMMFDSSNGDANEIARTVSVFMDIKNRVDASASETGLLGLAFAPDFATSRAFYINYTSGGPLRTIVSRFIADASGFKADPASETKIIEIPQPYTNHNGGELRFGPDKMLYIGMGDGGNANDPQGNAQNRSALLGKMLRIDPSGSSNGRNYRVPPDNPFAGQQGVREEIWALGMRNPWRFSFDRLNGALWVGDVGQGSREEVDLIVRGGNYGWNIMEGAQCRGGGSNCNRNGLDLPVIDYPTANGNCAIVGGFVYRGEAIPALRGAYVYGDYCSGKIWALRYDGVKVTEQAQIGAMSGMMSSFGEDGRGEIYGLAYGERGGIFKLVP